MTGDFGETSDVIPWRHPVKRLSIVYALFACATVAADPPGKPDLSEYNPPEKAITTTARTVAPARAGRAGCLVGTVAAQSGNLAVADVQLASPAEKAGLRKGDLIIKVDGRAVSRSDVFRETLQAHAPGETIKIAVQREGKPLDL